MEQDPIAADSSGIWDGDYKIPWDQPDFSRRMLAEHLTQDHDMASRRTEWIERQVDWLHRELLGARPASILDLGCGPGFYSHRLSALGHRCRGLDFGPASIQYARQHNAHPERCEFELADIRVAEFGGPHDVAMLLFGEMNSFSPKELKAILDKARASLAQGQGTLILEIQVPDAIERTGLSPSLEEQLSSGFFSDHPYHCRIDYQWFACQQVTVETYTIHDQPTSSPRIYRSTTQAWRAEVLTALLQEAGFRDVRQPAGWPCNVTSLALWSAATR